MLYVAGLDRKLFAVLKVSGNFALDFRIFPRLYEYREDER